MTGYDRPELEHLTEKECRLMGSILKIDPATVVGPPTGIIIGDMPPKNAGPNYVPMFPFSKAGVGGRLLKYSGLTHGQYFGKLIRVNLFNEYSDEWDRDRAFERAGELHSMLPKGFHAILLGIRVSVAFTVSGFFNTTAIDDIDYITIPHPSSTDLYGNIHTRVAAKSALQYAAGTITREQLMRAKR